MTNTMPMEIQHNALCRQNAIVDIALEIERLKTLVENLFGSDPSNGQFAQANEAPPPSPTPSPCAQNVPTCLEYPTIGHLDAGQTTNELSGPDDPFADTSYPIVPTPVAMNVIPKCEGDIGEEKKMGKTVQKTKKGAKKAESIMVDKSSTFSGEPEIQYPEIQHAPRDGSTANKQDLPQMTRLEQQFTVHFKSPTMPSKINIEF
ncbi:hypothetical protein MBLNU13_g11313t1 [Cladosporium sp. NU13]